MPSFLIDSVTSRAKQAYNDIVSSYIHHKRSFITSLKAYNGIARQLAGINDVAQSEAAELLAQKHKYATTEIVLTQLVSGTYGRVLETVKHYKDNQLIDNSNTMGDMQAGECDMHTQVQECFDASVVLELNEMAVEKIKTLFLQTLDQLIHLECGLTVNIRQAQGIYMLFANLMHNRYPALVKALDCRTHSYVFVNELTQLLIALQDAQCFATISESGLTVVVDLSSTCRQYLANNMRLDAQCEVLLLQSNRINTEMLLNNLTVNLEAVLAMQMMLTMVAQRELSHIIMHQELTVDTDKLVYDCFAAVRPHHLLMPVELRESKQRAEEIAHVLLTCRLKHMLHLRITYLILRKYQHHISYSLSRYVCEQLTHTNEDSAKHIMIAHKDMHSKSMLFADMLALSGDIACAAAEDMLLHMRAKIMTHILDTKMGTSLVDMCLLTHTLLSETYSTFRAYVTHDSIRHSLSEHRMGKTIAAVLRTHVNARAELRTDPTFREVIHDIFIDECNSEFTKYLCSRADYFVIGLCNDIEFIYNRELIHTITSQITTASEKLLQVFLSDNTQEPGAIVQKIKQSGSTMTPYEINKDNPLVIHSDTETDTDTETPTHEYGAYLLSRQVKRTKTHDTIRTIRQTMAPDTHVMEDTSIICNISNIHCALRTHSLVPQLDILNEANSVICARQNVQGIHLLYFSLLSTLHISHNALRAQLRQWSPLSLGTAFTIFQNAYKLTVFGAFIAMGVQLACNVIAK